jgi:cytochrome c biogenesis protein CcmG/thiol:disulfide interchange protein DsbE
MRKFLPFLILVFLISLIAIATYNLNNQQETSDSKEDQENGINFVKTNIPLPEFSLPDLFNQDETFSKKDLTGKYSVVSFFASWCSTCRAEHDILLRLRDEKIIDIYGIAWRDISENSKSFLEAQGNPYLKTASDSRALFTKIAGVQAIPETWIVDKSGTIVMRYRGNLQDFSIDEIRNFLRNN